MKLIPKMLLGLGLMALPAFCGAISENEWYNFSWSGNAPTDAYSFGTSSGYTGYLGTPVYGASCSPGTVPCDSFSYPWTFTGIATISVQDVYYDGDQFAVYDNGTLLGDTSVPSNDGTRCGSSPFNDPLGCVGNTKFSTGSFTLLSSGVNDISIEVIAETANLNSGSAVFELTAPTVPEPTTLSMMGLGLGGLLFGWRVRRKA